MQLTKKRGLALAQAITHASSLLLGATAAHVNAAENTEPTKEDHGWQVDTATLFYQETDSRVTAIEPVINLKKDYGDERALNLKLVLDGLTGASPNGAPIANVPQTFTGPSGNGTYSAPANKQPLNTEFKDTRFAFSGGWQQPIGNDMKINVGGNASKEYDFLSLGANGAIAKDFNNKNTTLSAGLNVEFNSIMAVGGAPVGLTRVSDNDKIGDQTRSQVDVLIGLTQILNRHSLVQLNYGLSTSSGYHTDPYKFLAILDGSNNLIPEGNPDTYEYLYEKRPDTRTKHSLFAQWKYIFTEDVIDLSYRFTTDDWGIVSNTIDAKYRWAATEKFYVEPHLRLYNQTEADFYKPYLVQGVDVDGGLEPTNSLPFASADTRLAAFDATTVGLKFGYILGRDSEVNLRVEQYTQTPSGITVPTSGDLAGSKVVPDLSAMWVQFGYSFRW